MIIRRGLIKELKRTIKGLKDELNSNIVENMELHREISQRPFKVTRSCSLVHIWENRLDILNMLKKELFEGNEIYVKANYKDLAVLTIRPIREDEEIFIGLIVDIHSTSSTVLPKDIVINSFIEFQVYDLYDLSSDNGSDTRFLTNIL